MSLMQAFDKWVAVAGKARASKILDQIHRSRVIPIIDRWTLVLVGLSTLRDCVTSRVWETSFIAVNLHPHFHISFDD